MTREERLRRLNAEMQRRLLILDGSMGAYLQGFGLTNNDFHGLRFAEHPMSLKGDTDLLTLTQPDIITKVHEAYIAAGADIISTNTFTANPISQAEYALKRLTELAHKFDDAAVPYRSLVHPMWTTHYGDYDHLARVKEWSAGGGPEGGE